MSKIGEFLESLALPFRAVSYEFRRFFSPPRPTRATEGRAVAFVMVTVGAFFLTSETGNILFALAVPPAMLLGVATANYLDGVREDMTPSEDDQR